VLGGINGPPCHWGEKIKDLFLQIVGLDARRTTSHCEKKTVVKSKEVKTGWSERQVWQNLLPKTMAQNGCFADDDDDNECNCNTFLHSKHNKGKLMKYNVVSNISTSGNTECSCMFSQLHNPQQTQSFCCLSKSVSIASIPCVYN
jgi:hypothetical protein